MSMKESVRDASRLDESVISQDFPQEDEAPSKEFDLIVVYDRPPTPGEVSALDATGRVSAMLRAVDSVAVRMTAADAVALASGPGVRYVGVDAAVVPALDVARDNLAGETGLPPWAKSLTGAGVTIAGGGAGGRSSS